MGQSRDAHLRSLSSAGPKVAVERIERRLAERADESERSLTRKREHQKEMVLGAMGISVPLLALAASFTGLPGVIAVCAALAVLAVASAT